MKRIGNIYRKICCYDNLLLAHYEARKGKAHYKEVKQVNSDEEGYLKNLEFILMNEFYNVNSSDYKREIIIDKGKEREILKLSYYPHRVVQWAIMLQLEDMFYKNLITDTYASVRGRGIHLAAKRIKKVLKEDEGNTKYCLKIDIKKYYPSINNNILYKLLQRKIKDPQLLRLLHIIIFSTGEKGQPIGSLWSQWAGNFYLSGLDHYVKEKLKIKHYFRYCDDIIFLDKNKEKLHEVRKEVELFLLTLDLELKENYQVFDVDARGIDFLGYRFFRNFTLLRKRVLKQFKTKIKRIRHKEILTLRDYGALNSYKGWLKYCNSYRLREKYLKEFQNKKYIDQKGNLRRINICIS